MTPWRIPFSAFTATLFTQCVLCCRIVDSFTLSVLATSIVKLGVPLMIYHGKRDEVRWCVFVHF